VKYMLGGKVSTETRQVLMSGENPMLSKTTDAGAMTASDTNSSTNSGINSMTGGGRGRQSAKEAGGKGFPRGRGAALPGFGRPVDLKGLSQVIGLALGAPEFQRR
jgi:hypothetical protein